MKTTYLEKPDAEDLREAARLFYMTKGHLGTSIDTIMSSAPGYMKRLWHNEEGYIYEEGFEEVYQKFLRDNRLETINAGNE